jgi:FkbM family methyltransferase
VLNKLFFQIQCLHYFLKIYLIKLHAISKKKFKIEDLNQQIDYFTFKGSNFLYPKRYKKKYNEMYFSKLNEILKNLFIKNNYPEFFIDIGSFIGLYGFLVNKIYLEKNKKLQIYSFEPTDFAYNILIKNLHLKNHKPFKVAVYNKNTKKFISSPKAYFNKTLSYNSNLNIYSMKSINEKSGYAAEEIKTIKLLDVIPAEKIRKAHIKIDTEGCEFEVINYLQNNNLYPQSLSLELNNHYLYKRFISLEKIISKKFLQKYDLYIDNQNSSFYITDIKTLKEKIFFDNKFSVIKKYFYSKISSIDLYLFKKT